MSLAGFPSWMLSPERVLYRVHRRTRSAWYFDSGPDGRFNLSPPNGTCYLAETAIGAFLETLGRQGQLIPQADVDERALSTIMVPDARRLADCTVARARGFGITTGIDAIEDYARTQQWARAFHAVGFTGIRYRISHDPRAPGVGIALFGSAGEASWPATPWEPIPRALLNRVERTFGLLILPTP
ncbi:MAG: hypothetical protein QOF51_1348 [Chloroflexota bacterium]|jgi:hypothetical protein|nr:hypothetical protein [Chloroflexota bacterium]